MDKRLIIRSIILTLLIETITLILRFGCKLESTTDTKSFIAPLTFGIRIHHGYIGLAILLLTYACFRKSKFAAWLYPIGIALFLSDIIHHFLVLWPIIGTPQFDLTY